MYLPGPMLCVNSAATTIWLTLHVFYLLLPTDTHIQITTWDCSWTVFGHRGRCLPADERRGVSCICPPSGRQQ